MTHKPFSKIRSAQQSGRCFVSRSHIVGRALRLPRLPFLSASLLLCLAGPSIAADQPKAETQPTSSPKKNQSAVTSLPWSKADTKIANHYIQILQGEPEYGRVLNLLWNLYRRHQQETLLLSYIKGAAEPADATVAKILYAHLLRKKGELNEALQYYQQALTIDANEIHALRGAAEILDQEEKTRQSLVLYDRLVKQLPAGHKDRLVIQLRRADLLKSAQRVDEAVAVWNQLLTQNPHDKKLRTRMVALLLETGRTDEAIRILKQQSQSQDAEEKLAALETLSNLYGFIDDFDKAIESTRQAKSLLHFKDYRYKHFFAVEERLYERFDRLKEFEKRLLSQVSNRAGSEQSLWNLAELFRLSAQAEQEQIWVQRLTQIAPGNANYSLRLAELLIENEKFQLAADQLDRLIEQQDTAPLSLFFMRSLAALNTDGKEAAETVLKQYLAKGNEQNTRPEAINRLLEFARYHYLDQIVEDLLSSSPSEQQAGSNDKNKAASLALAKFYSERGRSQKAKTTIAAYVKQNVTNNKIKARRLHEAAKVYAELKMFTEAEKTLRQALEITPSNKEAQLILASILTEAGKTDEAISTYNQLWQASPELSAQIEIDQLLFSLLRALIDKGAQNQANNPSPLLMGPPQTTAEHRRLALAASRNPNGTNTDEPLPEKLLQFYQTLKQQAAQQPDLRHKYRVAWWAFKLQDHREMYQQLTQLHQQDGTNIEVEKLMLELADQTGNTLLSGRQLKLLAEIDKDHQSDYLRRWAEFRFKMEYQDQAVRLMEELARKDDATLSTLRSLVGFYKRQGRSEDQLAVWRNAYQKASIDDKRQIAKQLTTTLLEMGKAEEAMEVQLDLIEKETDPIRQRRLFESQLTLATRMQKLPWLKKRYNGLVAQAPFERFYPEALGKIHRASGDPEAAYQVLKKAYYMSDQDQTLLAQLGELADQSNDLKAAIYYRRQLIVSDSSKNNLESWKLLVDMLEKDLRVAEADLTRKRFEGKFARDAGFLRESAGYYLKTHRPEEAQQFYQKLVKLRPWDSSLWLELGLLQKENGQMAEALASFHKAIDTTADDALPKDEEGEFLTYFPLVNGGWHSLSERLPRNSGLDILISGIQEYRFLESEQQEELTSWLRKPHAEFSRVPSPRNAIRLRAIEEAARLAKNDPLTLKKWIHRWTNDTDLSADERLWATFHAGAFEQSQSILNRKMLPLTSSQNRFFYTLLSLRMGHGEALFEQNKLASEQQDGSFSVLATLLLLQEDPQAVRQQDLETVFLKSPITLSIARHLQNNLQLDGKLESAYKIGVALARTQSSVDADFIYKIAQSAEWMGHEQKRLFWLERSLKAIEPNAVRGLPLSFFSIASELYQLRESAEEKTALLDFLQQKVEKHPAASPETILECRLNLAMISGDRDGVLKSLSQLTKNHLDSPRPNYNPASRRSYAHVEHWIGMERLLNEYVRRLPANISAEDFHHAMNSVDHVVSQDAAVIAQFQQFSMARLMWLLPAKSAPERRQLVAEFSTRLNDETLRLELARTLESRNFYRESIPVYHQLIQFDPNDFTLVRNFFTACSKAQDYQPALKLIERFLQAKLPRSSGMTDLYIAQKHALFLRLAGDVKNLLAYGQNPPATFATTSPELKSELATEYYRSLLKFYQENQLAGKEFDLLQLLKARKALTRTDYLSVGRLLLAENKIDESLFWLEALELNQSQPGIEMEGIRLLADIYAGLEENTEKKFADLTRQAIKYNNNDLVLHLAERLNQAGYTAMADSALLLQIRASAANINRAPLLLALIKSRLAQGAPIEDSATEMRALLISLQPGSAQVKPWFELIRNQAAANPQGLHQALQTRSPLTNKSGSKVLWTLSVNLLNEAQAKGNRSILSGLQPQNMDEAELMCAVEQTIESNHLPQAEQLLSDYANSKQDPLGFKNPARLLESLKRLKSDTRIAALHARLMAEPISEIFRRRVRISIVPNFINRHQLPKAFAEASYPNLAKSLYRNYYKTLQKEGRVAGDFLLDYAQFLITNDNLPEAESLLIQLFSRASASDEKTIQQASNATIDLYRKWSLPEAQKNAGAIDQRLKRYYLSSGLQFKIDQLRKQQ
ncbi:MAG: tetratricopeptide repeat protein [Verrucomicrobiota bacterium]